MNDEDRLREFRTANPLIAFSSYTHSQFETILAVETTILEELDNMFVFKNKELHHVDGSKMHLVHGFFWLWVLGSYEIVRTMSHKRDCFSEKALSQIQRIKKRLVGIRIPLAKQEYDNSSKTMRGYHSIYGVYVDRKDISFCISDEIIYVRPFMEDFRKTILSISIGDIVSDLRDSVHAKR